LVGRPGAVIPRPILSDPARVHYCAWNVLVIQRRAMCACYQLTLGGHACPVGRSDGVHNLFDTCLAAAWGAPIPEQHRRALRAAFIEHNLQRMLLSARLLLDGLTALPLDECRVLAPAAVTSFAGIAPRLDAMVGRQALVVANVVPAPLPATVVPPVAMPMLPLRALALLPVAPRHGGYQLDSSLGPLSSGSQLFPNGCLPIHFMERPVLMPPPVCALPGCAHACVWTVTATGQLFNYCSRRCARHRGYAPCGYNDGGDEDEGYESDGIEPFPEVATDEPDSE
jgi:hypothetical protein